MVHRSQRFVTVCFVLFLLSFGVTEGLNAALPLIQEKLQVLAVFGLVWSSTLWMVGCTQERGVKLPFDNGMLLWIFWPFPHLWYLFKLRGWRAVYLLVALFVVYVGGAFLGMYLASLTDCCFSK